MSRITPDHIKSLPAPSIRKLLREHGYTYMAVARRMGRSHALVSRVVNKKAKSSHVWAVVAEMLNERKAS
jgi:uncharacterized protein YerC